MEMDSLTFVIPQLFVLPFISIATVYTRSQCTPHKNYLFQVLNYGEQKGKTFIHTVSEVIENTGTITELEPSVVNIPYIVFSCVKIYTSMGVTNRHIFV